MKKKDLYKLTPGTILEILWLDAPPEAALLLEKPEKRKGDISLWLFYPDRAAVDSHATHEQVHCVLGAMEFPQCVSPEAMRLALPKPKAKAKSKKAKSKKVTTSKKKDAVKPNDVAPIDTKLVGSTTSASPTKP